MGIHFAQFFGQTGQQKIGPIFCFLQVFRPIGGMMGFQVKQHDARDTTVQIQTDPPTTIARNDGPRAAFSTGFDVLVQPQMDTLDAIGQAALGLKLDNKKKQRQADDTAAKAHWQLVFRKIT